MIYKQKVIICSECGMSYYEMGSEIHHPYCSRHEGKITGVVYPKDKEMSTQEKIDLLFNNFKGFLKEKNLRYGDSAINPLQIFSKQSADSQICNRLDDKLGRIKKSIELKKNDVSDMFGYIALLMIQNDWLDFEDLLD